MNLEQRHAVESFNEDYKNVGASELDKPADIARFIDDRCITKLMHLIWLSRPDLQFAFDLNTESGQRAYIHWYDVSVLREYGLTPHPHHDSGAGSVHGTYYQNMLSSRIPLHSRLIQLEGAIGRIGRQFPLPVRKLGKAIWLWLLRISASIAGRGQRLDGINSDRSALKSKNVSGLPGVTLIGYAHAELGMGEHVRMSAAAFNTTDVDFGVLNFDVGVSSRQHASLDYGATQNGNIYRGNIFHINADQMLRAYCHLGRNFFLNRYNIGYWAWELSKCPEAWVPITDLIDEIWAPSRFIQNAFLEKINKPVEYMPLCVKLPNFTKYERSHFRLPDNVFLFIFAFDFFSYIERKNPFAAIHAFMKAFADRSAHVGLVIKVMNGNTSDPNWRRMLELIGDDNRIHVINETMNRAEVLGLLDCCNCFVSLHRSEGFGRGPAEAMYLGKPVIVTNYSGNTDFTHPDNSCLVNYQLIPVKQGQYIFEDEQVWADADIEHAAWYMRKLATDHVYTQEVGLRGKEFIHSNYNPYSVGAIYRKRLEAISVI